MLRWRELRTREKRSLRQLASLVQTELPWRSDSFTKPFSVRYCGRGSVEGQY